MKLNRFYWVAKFKRHFIHIINIMFNFHISVISIKYALVHKILKTYSYNIKKRLNMYIYIFRYINVNMHIYSILKSRYFFWVITRNIYFILRIKYFFRKNQKYLFYIKSKISRFSNIQWIIFVSSISLTILCFILKKLIIKKNKKLLLILVHIFPGHQNCNKNK